jgi:hypothetical protein
VFQPAAFDGGRTPTMNRFNIHDVTGAGCCINLAHNES